MKAAASPAISIGSGTLPACARPPARQIRDFQMAAAGGPANTRGASARGVRKSSARGRDRVLRRRWTARRARHVGVQIVLADQDAAAGIVEDLHELALAQHRIARHDDRAALPGGEHRHEHLRDVLHVHRDAIAGLGALLLQRDGQPVRHRVELAGGQRSIEIVHQHGIGSRRCNVHRNISSAVALAGSMVLRVMTVSLLLLHSLHPR